MWWESGVAGVAEEAIAAVLLRTMGETRMFGSTTPTRGDRPRRVRLVTQGGGLPRQFGREQWVPNGRCLPFISAFSRIR